MKTTSPKPRQSVHPACRNFVAVVEELLAGRQRELQASPSRPAWLDADWGPRNWTRTEMEDMVYGSYKQMRQGRITRPPRRETVMEIADYLNCTLEERNRLLIAADATPVTPYLAGPELDSVVKIASRLAQKMAMPAMVINRDWRIHYFNEPLIRLYGVTPEQLAALSPDQFNVLHLLFDPRLPLYPRLIRNRASWARMARQTIYGFKSANVLYQFEPWYQDLLARLMTLPEFEHHWQTVKVNAPFDVDHSARAEPPAVTVDTLVDVASRPRHAWLHPLLISVGYFQFDFPQIVAFLPADAESESVFDEIGVPFPSLPLP